MMGIFKKLLTALRERRELARLPLHLREGRIGESAAARYLKRKGYRIVERNFVSGKNEIDIIAKSKDRTVFCEVKTRVQKFGEPTPFGPPSAAVTEEKQRHLFSAATTYMKRNRDDTHYRFDVIEVYLSSSLRAEHIQHIENAFFR